MRVEQTLIEASLFGYVAELAVAEILVQAAGVALELMLVGTVVVAAARDKDVEQAVAVVVD